MHIDNKRKNSLVLGKGLARGLDNTTLTTEAVYPVNFTESEKRFVLSLHYNGRDSFLFINASKIYQFKAKNSEIKPYSLCLGNISKNFTFDNMKKNRIKMKYTFFFLLMIDLLLLTKFQISIYF